EAAADSGGEGTDAKDAEPQQRPARAPGVHAVAEQKRQRHEQKPENLHRAQRVIAKDFQHIGEKREPRAEEDETYSIERLGALAIVRQLHPDKRQSGNAHRYIEEEDRAPMKIRDDEAARGGA